MPLSAIRSRVGEAPSENAIIGRKPNRTTDHKRNIDRPLRLVVGRQNTDLVVPESVRGAAACPDAGMMRQGHRDG